MKLSGCPCPDGLRQFPKDMPIFTKKDGSEAAKALRSAFLILSIQSSDITDVFDPFPSNHVVAGLLRRGKAHGAVERLCAVILTQDP